MSRVEYEMFRGGYDRTKIKQSSCEVNTVE